MKRWILFDTETTGFTLPSSADLKQQPAIIELALVVVGIGPDVCEAGVGIVGKHSWLINPGPKHPISHEITKITGLKEADLVGKPAFADILPEVTQIFLGAEGLCAHNL